MDTLAIILVSAIVASIAVFLLLKYVFHWVDVNKIPENEIEEAAKKLLRSKFDQAEQEIADLRDHEEKRLKEMRKESSEHEEILIEREKNLNKRSKILDEKSEDLELRETQLKQGIKKMEGKG